MFADGWRRRLLVKKNDRNHTVQIPAAAAAAAIDASQERLRLSIDSAAVLGLCLRVSDLCAW